MAVCLSCSSSTLSCIHLSPCNALSTAFNSTLSCILAIIRLSSSRIERVIFFSRWAIYFPMTIASGVMRTSAHASRLSNHLISRKAPASCIVITTTCGSCTANVSLTASMSFAILDVTSPECISLSSNKRRLNSREKRTSRSSATFFINALLARYWFSWRMPTPATTAAAISNAWIAISRIVPVMATSSMSLLLSHTTPRARTVCNNPAIMRTRIFSLMPRELSINHLA